MRSLSYGSGELNSTIRSTKPGKRSARSWITGPPRSPPTSTAALVAEVIVHERVRVAAVRRHVVEPVGRDVAVTEAAQVGHDDLEARLGERLDDPPPDALRLRPAVHEHERAAPPTFSCTYAWLKPRGSRGGCRTGRDRGRPWSEARAHAAADRSWRADVIHSRSTSACSVYVPPDRDTDGVTAVRAGCGSR